MHELLEAYLNKVEEAVGALPAYAESYTEEILTAERANLAFRLRFSNGFLLEVSAAMVVDAESLKTLGYRYHCQDASNTMLIRYDDTPHFRNLPTFPHHKHIKDAVIAHNEPDLLLVLQEVSELEPN
ncbi:MAG: hypothetical protein BWK73_25005 [Thiothrix lacustris]|uniref:Uncharacterized protein n=1 Tax=Thiothrix lacustris TaxID=525917 RepID=A0A1Y1QM25_9GAMM|nr:MAG: hypothetical protein BWK73_25005 [Thiothrix lacustris]